MLVIKLYQKYISFSYIKNFFIIFFALEIFYVGVDLLSNLKDLPSSANLQLLYVIFTAQTAVNYTLPLGLVFAMIVSKLSMIRSNELISFYASGISKRQVVSPILFASTFFVLLYIGLNFTDFAYSNEYKRNLLKYNRLNTDISKLFVKYDDKYIFFDSFSTIQKKATGVKIFDTNDTKLENIISAQVAYYKDNAWFFKDANITTYNNKTELQEVAIIKKSLKNQTYLSGFKPTIIDAMQAEKKNSLSILDAYEALKFLSKQTANTSEVKSIFLGLLFTPFFAPLMVVILFYHLPAIGRFFNLALLSFLLIFVTLCIWGVIFVASRFSATGVISPEIATILPIVLLFLYAIKLLFAEKNL